LKNVFPISFLKEVILMPVKKAAKTVKKPVAKKTVKKAAKKK